MTGVSRCSLSFTIVIPPDQQPPRVESASDQTSAYRVDLEDLLNRIDAETTYYDILEVDRLAPQDQVKASFERVLEMLFPPYAVGKTVSTEVTPRIETAFTKASQAFAALASFPRRSEYDKALLSLGSRPAIKKTRKRLESQDPSDEVSIKRMPNQRKVFMESTEGSLNENRRRCERLKLSIPVRITGYDHRGGKWHEMAQTLDVSRTGVRLRLRTRVKIGRAHV